MKAITTGEPTTPKGAGQAKGKAPALPKGGGKGKNKGKKGERSITPGAAGTNKASNGKKGTGNGKPALTQRKSPEASSGAGKSSTSTGTSRPVTTPSTPQPKAAVSRPGKIPRQCAYVASEGGCQKGDKCLYLHEMEGGRPKPALPEDVAKLEARAKANPALRPPSKPPVKATVPTSTPIAKMRYVQDQDFDFSIYYDCQEGHDMRMFSMIVVNHPKNDIPFPTPVKLVLL